MNKDWKPYKISELLIPCKVSAVIKPECTYKQVKVRLAHKGVELRKEISGSEIGSSQYSVKTGQFIISKIDARNGAMGLIPKELDNAIVTNDFPVFDLSEKVNRDFFTYYSQLPLFDFVVKSASEGTTNRRRLKLDRFNNYVVNLPLIEEQERIISKIKNVEHKISKIKILCKAQINEVNQLAYSRYIDLTNGVKFKPMNSVAPIIRRPVEIDLDTKYPELGIRNFGKGTFHKPALTGLEVGTKKIYQIKTGDLIFSNVFAWEGGIAVAQDEDNDRYGSHRFISCNCDLEQVLPEFLNFHFLSQNGLEEIIRCSPGGAGRNKTLGLKKLEAIKVPVPDIEEQKKFVSLLLQFNQLEKQKVEREKELSELIPSLLDKAFKGEF
jgi:type I restriction enzyme S subunit